MDAPSEDAALIAAYLAHVRVEKRLAARTQALYAAHLATLQRRAQAAGLALTAVREDTVRRWLAQLHAAGQSPRTLALVLSAWRGFYDWLGRQGRIDHHPVRGVRAPKAGRPLPKALPVEAALRLVQAVPEDGASCGALPGNAATGGEAAEAETSAQARAEYVRDRAMVELLYGSGLRLGELLGLDVAPGPQARGWVDADAGEAHVTGKGGQRRTVPVTPAALAALAEWCRARALLARPAGEPALFVGARGERLSPQVARRRLAAWAARAGLDVHVHPHMLRHSFASHVLQSSGDLRGVQELLGHASIASTQVYTRLDFQHLSRVYEAAHPRARRSGAGERSGERPGKHGGVAAAGGSGNTPPCLSDTDARNNGSGATTASMDDMRR
ncbi:tyrosine-type recombinase/integrase [Tepidimonas taiwanensis]|uniref:tyrosine-type recombinase/integrase n=1 Tax=Tepidimonas taiwanensis TaxID=307486 RepID=UPI0009DFA7FD|nr:tyrosine-type recombinase/integrase [Tepidimonas taiwanensis]